MDLRQRRTPLAQQHDRIRRAEIAEGARTPCAAASGDNGAGPPRWVAVRAPRATWRSLRRLIDFGDRRQTGHGQDRPDCFLNRAMSVVDPGSLLPEFRAPSSVRYSPPSALIVRRRCEDTGPARDQVESSVSRHPRAAAVELWDRFDSPARLATGGTTGPTPAHRHRVPRPPARNHSLELVAPGVLAFATCQGRMESTYPPSARTAPPVVAEARSELR